MKVHMKHYFLLLALLVWTSFLSAQTSFREQLEALPFVTKIEKLDSNTGYTEKYKVDFTQALDHTRPEAGNFTQRVFVLHKGEDRPTVMVTEGYGAAYAANPNYNDELAGILDANIIVVEHRYFLESTPKPLNWDYLTVENSVNDLHRVNQTFKKIYKNKWLSTGISKGGMTVNFYRTFFPEDVDVSVPYVAPLCKDVEDGRHEPFIRNFAGTPQDRKTIQDFQKDVLKRRAQLMPLFEKLCEEKGYKTTLPLDEIYDYCVLEFSFAFWQWGTSVEAIPASTATDKEIFDYFVRISGPDYFTSDSNAPFFVQVVRELGYYGYDTKPFEGLLTIETAKGYIPRVFLPEEAKGITFDQATYDKVEHFIATTDAKMVFIYGEYDPWSAAAVTNPHSPNALYLVVPQGSHRARIRNLPDEIREQAIQTIKDWIAE